MTKPEIGVRILELAFSLENIYPELNFKHHCYLRIAYDTSFQDKWNRVIKSPLLKNALKADLEVIVGLLELYIESKRILLEHNNNSLNYRKKNEITMC